MLNLKLIINAEDRASSALRRLNSTVEATTRRVRQAGAVFRQWAMSSSFETISRRMKGVGDAWSSLQQRMLRTTAIITAGVGAGIYAFKRMFLDTAAKFERFETILGTLERSSAGAKKAMDWVSTFAAKTPYELDGVMEAFVRLRAYGMDPTNGLLRTLGDTSAAMGKQLMDAVEAIADAVTGENERLKEFGIKARQIGKNIVYEYSQDGKTMTAVAAKNSREQIQAVLSAIFNEKYAGAMDKLSTTWDGLWSNMMDQYTRFTNNVMSRGPFDAIKARLANLLDRVNAMADSGALDRLAEQWAGVFLRIINGVDRLIFGFDVLGSKGKTLHMPGLLETLPRKLEEIEKTLQPVVDLFGGWGRFIGIVSAAIIAGPLIAGIGSLTLSLTLLGVASSGMFAKIGLLTFGPAIAAIGNFITALRAGYGVVAAFNLVLAANPIGAVVVGLTALAGAAFLIYKNWSPIADFFSGVWDGIVSAFEKGWAYISPIVEKIWAVMNWSPLGLGVQVISSVASSIGAPPRRPGDAPPPGAGASPSIFAKGAGGGQVDVGGRLDIHVTSDGQAVVKRGRSNNPRMDLSVHSGLNTAGAS
ncbi:MAG: hypothetical protein GC184_14605 [Rhizobiales bacterium]|nr:hypothetical protein [Hyphomicrobiales bacterium]